ncbi:MAG: hemerythrin domain-containing protein, partial [Lachnospiraceae bacterium]|nr:hemerythrin domain-containing protein [Lachnospiraceae bacterium]
MYLFTEDCLIGVSEIDSEHERLFEIINEIQVLLEEDVKSDQYDRIGKLLEHLKLYAKEHFQHEEAYMERIHHPELELQRHQHSAFCDKINEADILLSGSDQTRFLEDLLKYLITWLYRHIIGCDLMIGKMKPIAAGKKLPTFADEYLTGINLIDDEHREL